MGDRAGYRIRVGVEVSDILRKQWAIDDLRDLISDIAKTLLCDTGIVGNGTHALRHDLGMERMSAALFNVAYSAPFDRICKDIQCDITNNGIFEMELIEFDHWRLWHLPLKTGSDNKDAVSDVRLLADIKFISGKRMPEAMEITVQE